MECVHHRSRASSEGEVDLGPPRGLGRRSRVYIPESVDLGCTSWWASISGVGGNLWVDLGFIPKTFKMALMVAKLANWQVYWQSRLRRERTSMSGHRLISRRPLFAGERPSHHLQGVSDPVLLGRRAAWAWEPTGSGAEPRIIVAGDEMSQKE